MAKAREPGKNGPRGKVRLEVERDGKTLSVQLDRPGFRRLIQTLEQLAETGEPQTFERSGRGSAKSGSANGQPNMQPHKLIFHISDK